MCVIACSILSLTPTVDWMLFYTKASNLLNGALGLISYEIAWYTFCLGTIAQNKFLPVYLHPAFFLLQKLEKIMKLWPPIISPLILLSDRWPLMNGLIWTSTQTQKCMLFRSTAMDLNLYQADFFEKMFDTYLQQSGEFFP